MNENILLPEGITENEAIERRYYSQKERESMDEEDFAGPHRSYPIKSQEDVHNAAKLIGHADNPDAVKARIKSIAKKKGFKLPDSWEEEKKSEDSEDRSTLSPLMSSGPGAMIQSPVAHDTHNGTHDHHHQHSDGYAHSHGHDHFSDSEHDHTHGHAHHRLEDGTLTVDRATSIQTNHISTSGSHHHQHTHMDGYSHSHHHVHQEDADHDHSHIHAHPHHNHPQQRTIAIEDKSNEKEAEHMLDRSESNEINQFSLYMPFMRIDKTKREVIGQATAEVPDSYGTIFAYYPKAWEQWRGNIREQHDPKKAVGKRIQHHLREDEKSVDLHAKVSRGASDTWLKVEDDVLTGFSLSVIPDAEFGNNISKWPKKEYEGKLYPYLPRYSIAEVSLVDNPSCPGCNIQIVRADGTSTDILEDEEEPDIDKEEVEEVPEITDVLEPEEKTITRNKSSLHHDAIGHTLHAAYAQMKGCNCPVCQDVMRMIDPDNDGDIDLGGYDDPDNDATMPRTTESDMERLVTGLIDRSMNPAYIRLQKVAGEIARINAQRTEAFDRVIKLLEEKFAALPVQSSFDELRAELLAVKGQVDKIAEQPVQGGPILNASALSQPVEKRVPTDAPIAYSKQSYGSVYDAIAQLSKAGQLDTENKQVDAMTAGLIAQRQNRR